MQPFEMRPLTCTLVGALLLISWSVSSAVAREAQPAESSSAAATDAQQSPAEASENQPQEESPAAVVQPWQDSYAKVMHQARSEHKMALLWFYTEKDPEWNQYFERYVIADEDVQKCLANFVAGKLPLDAQIDERSKQEDDRVLRAPAFGELAGQPGLVIVDMRDEQSPYFHHVVSIYPFRSGPVDSYGMYALLSLPPGTLTQRTLVWAVMTHPERPMSAFGSWSGTLSAEAESHAHHQASIRVQGHHQWGSRFHRITSRLPGGLAAQEVCAESWPGQGLVEAARECVHSWRQSSGHWDAVRRRHPLFGYDMKRGANGVWYAAGIFGRRH